MQLMEVDKRRYRQRVNRVITLFVVSLAVLSVALGSLLITLFGYDAPRADGSTGNFGLNLIGVLLALALCSAVLHRFRHHPYLTEVFYVWRLKQMMNRIYRQYKSLEARAEKGSEEALKVLCFYALAQKQVYQLDDNTLTLSEVEQRIQRLEKQVAPRTVEEMAAAFEPKMLTS
ncbi:DUF3087 family protein [Ferrimonas gelatinilytica]|uniref:DUF3087 domain-containing protein n=1 Tax=Ferrimonas gelatinilytica TaxID=1255257 RepID=A0ABP9S5K5_9GAMM